MKTLILAILLVVITTSCGQNEQNQVVTTDEEVFVPQEVEKHVEITTNTPLVADCNERFTEYMYGDAENNYYIAYVLYHNLDENNKIFLDTIKTFAKQTMTKRDVQEVLRHLGWSNTLKLMEGVE